MFKRKKKGGGNDSWAQKSKNKGPDDAFTLVIANILTIPARKSMLDNAI